MKFRIQGDGAHSAGAALRLWEGGSGISERHGDAGTSVNVHLAAPLRRLVILGSQRQAIVLLLCVQSLQM